MENGKYKNKMNSKYKNYNSISIIFIYIQLYCTKITPQLL